MRFGIWPSATQPWDDVVEVARHAEATGWDAVYVADHFMADADGPWPEETPTLEATAALPALASLTERVRLAPLVLGITYRHPAVLAKWAATVDHVSGGRFTLGLGAGWQENEHRQYGIALGSPRERLARFEEALLVLEGLLREPRTTIEGDHYQVCDALAEPKPVQPKLPILIGGKGDRMLRIVARHADIWNIWSTPELMAERGLVLDAACEGCDRDPGTIERSTQALFFLVDDDRKADDLVARVAPRAAVGGGVDRLADAVAAWRDAGVDEVIVPDFTLGTGSQRTDAMDLLIEQVAAQFR